MLTSAADGISHPSCRRTHSQDRGNNPRRHPQSEGWQSKTTSPVRRLGIQDDVPSHDAGIPRRHPQSVGWESKTTSPVRRLGIQDDVPSHKAGIPRRHPQWHKPYFSLFFKRASSFFRYLKKFTQFNYLSETDQCISWSSALTWLVCKKWPQVTVRFIDSASLAELQKEKFFVGQCHLKTVFLFVLKLFLKNGCYL